MLRRLQALILATILVVAAFSTGYTFLFYLLYLGILVIGGSYVLVRLVNGTRNHPDVYLGASPRGSIALYRAGQALAGLLGRDYVIPDDIKALAEPALAHRLIIKTSSSIHDVQAGQVVRELLESTAIDGVRPTGGGPTDLRAAATPTSTATSA